MISRRRQRSLELPVFPEAPVAHYFSIGPGLLGTVCETKRDFLYIAKAMFSEGVTNYKPPGVCMACQRWDRSDFPEEDAGSLRHSICVYLIGKNPQPTEAFCYLAGSPVHSSRKNQSVPSNNSFGLTSRAQKSIFANRDSVCFPHISSLSLLKFLLSDRVWLREQQ